MTCDAHDGPAILTVMVRLALAYAEVSGEVDLATSIPKRPDEDYWLCEPRNDYEFDLARTIITNCADRARNSGLVNPAVDLCFTGFGRLHGDEDTLAEFTGAPPAGPARPRIPWAPTSVCLRTVWTVAGERGEHRGIIDAELRPCEQAVLDGPHVGDRDVVAAIAGAAAALGAADGDDFVATRPRRTALAPSNVERAAYGRCHRPDAAP